eukprot:1243631-Pleurochrysis_carterae.AAC.3
MSDQRALQTPQKDTYCWHKERTTGEGLEQVRVRTVREEGRAAFDIARELRVRHRAGAAPQLELELELARVDVSLIKLVETVDGLLADATVHFGEELACQLVPGAVRHIVAHAKLLKHRCEVIAVARGQDGRVADALDPVAEQREHSRGGPQDERLALTRRHLREVVLERRVASRSGAEQSEHADDLHRVRLAQRELVQLARRLPRAQVELHRPPCQHGGERLGQPLLHGRTESDEAAKKGA